MSKPAWRNLLLFLAYVPLHWLLFHPANVIWYPPAGLHFAFLLLLPLRWWVPMALWLCAWGHMMGDAPWPSFVDLATDFIGESSGALLLKLHGKLKLDDGAGMTWLLAAMLLSSAGNALKLVVFRESWNIGAPASELFLQLCLGNYIGMLTIAPLILMVIKLPPRVEILRHWRFDVPMILTPVLGLSAWLLVDVHGNHGYQLAAGIALPMAIYFAFRSGWRGVSLLLSSVSLLIGIVAWYRNDLPSTLGGQLFLALAGSTLLLLGVAVDSLWSRERELAQRNRELVEIAQRLRDTARRNQTQADDLRRWITGEVHDEVGQNLTALQLQIRLAENDSGQPQLLAPMREIVGHMRHSVSALLNQLRPAGIDEFGLRRTLAEGSVAELLRIAGVQYRLHIGGDVDALDGLADDAQISLYRIVQETATNALRHAHATCFSVHLRVHRDGSKVHAILRCADNGGGIDKGEYRVGGLGMNGINDRVVSFGGRLRIRSDEHGTRILSVITFS